jgi:predicted secreted protein
MRPTTIVAIYFLFWMLSLFFVLPFGVKTSEEAGQERVPGQADSAPAQFRPWTIVQRTTILSGLLFALFYLNYSFGWVTTESLLSLMPQPPA